MSGNDYVTLAGSVFFLGLAGLTAARGRRQSPLAFPTALLCVDLFAYAGFELLGNLSGAVHWEWFEAGAAALAAPLLFHLVLSFLGARRRHRVTLVLAYVFFGAVALACAAPLVVPSWAEFPSSDSWALAMLAGLAPTFGFGGVMLVRHYQQSGDAEERGRTLLFLVAVLLGVGSPATDLAAMAGAEAVPHFAASGLLLSAILLTAFALRARFVRGALLPLLVTALLIGVIGVVGQVLVFRWFGGGTAALVVGTIFVTVVVLSAARVVWSQYTEVRERTAHLATLGRLSAQMAHDIRNPLAAIHGAAQYLDEERKRGGTLEEHREFLELILDQTQRLENVVKNYRRLGQAEPTFEEVDVDTLLRKVAEGARLQSGGVVVDVDETRVGKARVDPELVTTALENLTRNAIEAFMESEDEGRVRLSAARSGSRIVLCVTDDGPGMDARTREEAEQAFFTTKAQGSGLGLAFVKRVAQAHRGKLVVRSALARGTTVELWLETAPT